MKTDDIFEAFTDIDDNFIAAARPSDLSDESVVIRPAPRKPLWKTLVPAAACLAVLCTAGAFGVRYFKTRFEVETSNTSKSAESLPDQNSGGNTSTPTAEAPGLEEIKIFPTGVKNEFSMEEFPSYTFAATYSGVLLNGYEMNGVDMQIISADYIDNLFLCDLNGDGKRELCATVQNGGVRSVEILVFESGDRYTTDYQKWTEAYLQANYIADEKTLAMYERNGKGSDLLVVGGAPSLDYMTHIFANTSEAVRIGSAADEDQTFELAEFSDLYFEKRDNAIIIGEKNSETMRDTVMYGVEFFLADLNGDGMREICAWDSWGSGLDYRFINVYDIANDEKYNIEGKVMENLIRLELEDGVLYLVTSEYDHETDKVISREPLAMSMLRKAEKQTDYTEVPLFFDQTFTLPDFEGFTFTVDTSTVYPTFIFNWENNSKGIGNNAERVFLCDLDGDGRREIIVCNMYTESLWVRVYGFMDDGEIGATVYVKNGNYWIGERDGKLVYVTNDGEEGPLELKKSDLKPNFTQSYCCEILGWDHTIDYSEIIQWGGKYECSVADRRLTVTQGDELLFDSGTELEELYWIAAKEIEGIYFVFTQPDGKVGVVKITENDVESYTMADGLSLKPAADDLMVVDKNGDEKPFIIYYRY